MHLTWLKNAYSMETDILNTLEAQVTDFNEYLDTQRLIEQHIKETKSHMERLEECLKRHGEEIPSVKSGLASVMGTIKGATMDMSHDKVVRNLLMMYSAEHLEIASYETLIESAKVVEDEEGVSVYESILREEEVMSDALKNTIPNMVQKFLQTHQ